MIRQVLARQAPVEVAGSFHSHPYTGPDATGLGKPLKPITHPLRSSLPVLLGAEGPKNIAQTVRIADGWLPLYWSPRRTDVYEASLTGLARGLHDRPDGPRARLRRRGGGAAAGEGDARLLHRRDGHAARNFHADLMARMGFEEEARRIQELFLQGRKEEAVHAVPDVFADEISLIGPRARIAEKLAEWRKGPVTDLLVTAPDPRTLRVLAELNN
ncbi:LLM class F420-dependent oxidoreductase OS=Streptomyces microflavus OX=1919 GN=Smic_20950 PE=4 SV=1 [Streptomyces microflavus]